MRKSKFCFLCLEMKVEDSIFCGPHRHLVRDNYYFNAEGKVELSKQSIQRLKKMHPGEVIIENGKFVGYRLRSPAYKLA